MTPGVIDNFSRAGFGIAHFTQAMWAKTTHIGCALSKSIPTSENDLVRYYIACNYGPKGNMHEQTVYERGEGCSKCPDGVPCNVEFPALCGEVDESQIYSKISSVQDIVSAGVTDSASFTVGANDKTSVTVLGDTETHFASKDAATNAVTKTISNAVTTVVAGQHTNKNPTQVKLNPTTTKVPKVRRTKKNCTNSSTINVVSLMFIFTIYLTLLFLIQ
ncbi:unnamed protein product [Diabrotica balteata]|uniref:SCP domain-containing protein n=1 Tax=Diabrotica balteata TaxID=107213 RepID=A0A9N9TBZ7_DIABA|nr:unnamed protein product [Diabrotica balteata]